MTPAPASARNSHSPANGAAGSPEDAADAGDREGSGGGLPGGEGVSADAVAVGVTVGEGAGRVSVPVTVAVALHRGAGNGGAAVGGGVGIRVPVFARGVGVSVGTEAPAVGVARRATTTLGPQDRAGSRRAAAARARVFPDAHVPRQNISSVRFPANPRLLRGEPSPIPPCRPLARERSRIRGKYNRRPGVTFRTTPPADHPRRSHLFP